MISPGERAECKRLLESQLLDKLLTNMKNTQLDLVETPGEFTLECIQARVQACTWFRDELRRVLNQYARENKHEPS